MTTPLCTTQNGVREGSFGDVKAWNIVGEGERGERAEREREGEGERDGGGRREKEPGPDQ